MLSSLLPKRKPEPPYQPVIPPRPPAPPRATEVFAVDGAPAPKLPAEFAEWVAARDRLNEIHDREARAKGRIREIQADAERAVRSGTLAERRGSAAGFADPSKPLPDRLAGAGQHDQDQEVTLLKRELRTLEDVRHAAENRLDQIVRKISPEAVAGMRQWHRSLIRQIEALSKQLAACWQAEADAYNAIGDAGLMAAGSLLDGGPARPAFANPGLIALWFDEMIRRGLIEPSEENKLAARMEPSAHTF